MNIQQINTSEVANTETVMTDIEELDPPQQQDISNVFAAADLSYCSSYDSVKYKSALLKANLIISSVFIC